MRFKLAKRIIAIGWSTVNTLSGAAFSVLLSVEVIRLCSKELWGSMVEVLLWLGLASHILAFGNTALLLREFSLVPKNIFANWAKSLQARTWLYFLICIVLTCLPVEVKLKLLLFVFLSANFLYRSYDVVILYKRKFIISVLLETAGFLIIALYILPNRNNMSLNRLVLIYAIAELLKAVSAFILFRKEFKLPAPVIAVSYQLLANGYLALPFFMLQFTGLLQSKTDLICVTWFLTKDKIAQYQVYINFLLLIQSAAGFMLAPFIKNIYRLKSKSVKKLALKFSGLGLVLAFASIPFIYFFISYFYGFSISPYTLLAGAFFIIPIFYYALIVYQLIKAGLQNIVILFNIIGVILSFVLNIILIPHSADGISGAILAIAITQWILLFIYILAPPRFRLLAKKEILL